MFVCGGWELGFEWGLDAPAHPSATILWPMSLVLLIHAQSSYCGTRFGERRLFYFLFQFFCVSNMQKKFNLNIFNFAIGIVIISGLYMIKWEGGKIKGSPYPFTEFWNFFCKSPKTQLDYVVWAKNKLTRTNFRSIARFPIEDKFKLRFLQWADFSRTRISIDRNDIRVWCNM